MNHEIQPDGTVRRTVWREIGGEEYLQPQTLRPFVLRGTTYWADERYRPSYLFALPLLELDSPRAALAFCDVRVMAYRDPVSEEMEQIWPAKEEEPTPTPTTSGEAPGQFVNLNTGPFELTGMPTISGALRVCDGNPLLDWRDDGPVCLTIGSPALGGALKLDLADKRWTFEDPEGTATSGAIPNDMSGLFEAFRKSLGFLESRPGEPCRMCGISQDAWRFDPPTVGRYEVAGTYRSEDVVAIASWDPLNGWLCDEFGHVIDIYAWRELPPAPRKQ